MLCLVLAVLQTVAQNIPGCSYYTRSGKPISLSKEDIFHFRLESADSCSILADGLLLGTHKRLAILYDQNFRVLDTVSIGRDSVKQWILPIANSQVLVFAPVLDAFALKYHVADFTSEIGRLTTVTDSLPKVLHHALASMRNLDINPKQQKEIIKAPIYGVAAFEGNVALHIGVTSFQKNGIHDLGQYLVIYPYDSQVRRLNVQKLKVIKLPTPNLEMKRFPELADRKVHNVVPDIAGVSPLQWIEKDVVQMSSAKQGHLYFNLESHTYGKPKTPGLAYEQYLLGTHTSQGTVWLEFKPGKLFIEGVDNNYQGRNKIGIVAAFHYQPTASGYRKLKVPLTDEVLTGMPQLYFAEAWQFVSRSGKLFHYRPQKESSRPAR